MRVGSHRQRNTDTRTHAAPCHATPHWATPYQLPPATATPKQTYDAVADHQVALLQHLTPGVCRKRRLFFFRHFPWHQPAGNAATGNTQAAEWHFPVPVSRTGKGGRFTSRSTAAKRKARKYKEETRRKRGGWPTLHLQPLHRGSAARLNYCSRKHFRLWRSGQPRLRSCSARTAPLLIGAAASSGPRRPLAPPAKTKGLRTASLLTSTAVDRLGRNVPDNCTAGGSRGGGGAGGDTLCGWEEHCRRKARVARRAMSTGAQGRGANLVNQGIIVGFQLRIGDSLDPATQSIGNPTHPHMAESESFARTISRTFCAADFGG